MKSNREKIETMFLRLQAQDVTERDASKFLFELDKTEPLSNENLMLVINKDYRQIRKVALEIMAQRADRAYKVKYPKEKSND